MSVQNKFALAVLAMFVSCGLVAIEVAADQLDEAARRFVEENDRDGDGQLSEDELPQRMQKGFRRVDKDRDGKITVAEHAAFRRLQRNNPQQRPKSDQPALPRDTKILRDLEYVAGGHERQKLDLYLPAKMESPQPLIVWIHGGAWRAGNKNGCPAKRFVSDGVAVASLNYRLSQHAQFPAQIHDCKAAIRWLRANAEKYGFDGKRIGVWGSSAGGHLVAMLGTAGDVEELEGDLGNLNQSSRVQAVCDYFGPADMLTMQEHAPNGPFDHDAADSPEAQLIGGPIQETKEVARQASPINYVSEDDPPFLICHGDQDRLVGPGQSRALHEALSAANVDSTLKIVEGAGHGQFRDPEVVAMVESFFQRALKFDPRETSDE